MHDSWHLQDSDEDQAGAALNVDWRAYAQTHTLTDRQRKLADNIKKRENRIAALQREVDKIRVRTTMLAPALDISALPCCSCAGSMLQTDDFSALLIGLLGNRSP
jgi:hypothetical protein